MTVDEDIFDDLGATAPAESSRTATAMRIARGLGRVFAVRRNRIIAGVAVTTVVLASGTGAVYAAMQNASGDYRTAVAETADVSETLSLSGQLASSSSTDVAFQVGGTVAEVLVALGDTVTAGQQLATLDTTDLQEAVTSAEDVVADAAQTLEDDLEAQSSGSSSSSSVSTDASSASMPSTTSPATTGTGSASSSAGNAGGSATTAPGTQKAVDEVAAAQEELLAQYESTAAANEASTSAFAQAQTVCAPFLSATLAAEEDANDDANTDGTTADETSTDEATADATEGDDGATGDAAATDQLQDALSAAQTSLAECQDAITTSQSAQTTTTTAATALTSAAATLNEKVAALQRLLGSSSENESETADDSTSTTSAPSTGSSAAPSSASTTSDSSSSPSGTAGASGSNAETTITAERILADQAAIDLANAELAIAQQNLAFAAITSPIGGTVVSVALAAGDSVSAGSSTSIITIQGDGGYIVQATVLLSRIAGVETGQSAEITLPAFGATYTGAVSSIGVLNVSETSTPSYTVTVAMDAGDDSPRIGATADVDIELSDATGVLTVPTSAVTRTGTEASVVRLVDGKPETIAVTLGAIGSERTEIADGLTEGDTVVLADLDQAITTDDGSSSTGLTGLGGSSGGAGFPGGDFPSGDFPTGGGFQAPTG